MFKAYPVQNAYCLLMVKMCADEDEMTFVKEYIKQNDIYIRLGIFFMLFLCTVSEKTSTFYICDNLVRCDPILSILGRNVPH